MAYKDSLLYQARHRKGNFELSQEPQVAQAPPKPVEKPLPARTVRTVTIQVHTRKPHVPKQPSVAPPIVAPPPAVAETTDDPDARLTGLQREMLQALNDQRDNIGADIMVEAQNVVRRNIKSVSIEPTSDEQKIFHAIGIPGF